MGIVGENARLESYRYQSTGDRMVSNGRKVGSVIGLVSGGTFGYYAVSETTKKLATEFDWEKIVLHLDDPVIMAISFSVLGLILGFFKGGDIQNKRYHKKMWTGKLKLRD